MCSIEAINRINGTTKADLEGGSFQIVDGVRVSITPGIVAAQLAAQPDAMETTDAAGTTEPEHYRE